MWKQTIPENGEPNVMNDINNDATNLSETEELRRTWYQYVLHSFEKLDSRIDNISDDSHKLKDDLRADLDKCKEDIRKEVIGEGRKRKEGLDTLEKRIEAALLVMSNRVEVIEGTDIKEKLRAEILDITKEITKLKDEILSPLSIKIAKIETKVMMWGAIFGAAGSLVAAVLMSIIKALYLQLK